MVVTHLLRSLEDLGKHFSLRLKDRCQRLLRCYEQRGWLAGGVNVWRAASLACAFFMAAQEGKTAVIDHFSHMLHGLCADRVEIAGQPVLLNEDDTSNEHEELLMWDMASLMLEEDASVPQRAFDVAGNHTVMAYLPEVTEEVATACLPKVTEEAAMAGPPEGKEEVATACLPEVKEAATACLPKVTEEAATAYLPEVTEEAAKPGPPIPSATLLRTSDRFLFDHLAPLGISYHMFPDQDEPGERLFLQLRELLPGLVHHQLPKDCKDFGEWMKNNKDAAI